MSEPTAKHGTGVALKFPALRYHEGSSKLQEVALAREVPYTLFVNDREILSFATLPVHLKELAVGFLVSEGVLEQPADLEECHLDAAARIIRVEVSTSTAHLDRLEGKGMLTSGCAGGMVFAAQHPPKPREYTTRGRIQARTILDRMRDLETYKGTYTITRGVHAAAVADEQRLLAVLEDVGRHNAVDKVIGHCFLHGIATSDKLLLTTGRITSEILTKAARSGFSFVASRSSASSMAATLAAQFAIDIATYVRAGRFNYFPNGALDLVTD